MNLFDRLVEEALENHPSLSPLRMVIEKELLHHDILRIMSQHHLLEKLTFIGGTCLRACYGGVRLSEDLDFSAGSEFKKEDLKPLSRIIRGALKEKYGLAVRVAEPLKESGNVDTWKILVETRPEKKHMPSQRIHIDICSVPSYERRPMLLLNPYGVDMGTSGLIIQAQSQEELYTDKLIALALRPNRVKNRDLWDISWLHQQGIKPRLELLEKKLNNRHVSLESFQKIFEERLGQLHENDKSKIAFQQEMKRFLPAALEIDFLALWKAVLVLLKDLRKQFG